MFYNSMIQRNLKTTQLRLYSSPVEYGFSQKQGIFGCEEEKEKTELDLYMQKMRNQQFSKARSVQQIYSIAKNNTYDWFFTWTFDPKIVDRFNYDDCAEKLGYWIDRHRRYFPNLKYLIVPELHMGTHGHPAQRDVFGNYAYHFHGVVSGLPDELFTYAKTIKGKEIYNVNTFPYGFTTASKILDMDATANYIGKYITKDLTSVTMGRKRFWYSKDNTIIPDKRKEYLTMNYESSNFYDDYKDILNTIKKECMSELLFEKKIVSSYDDSEITLFEFRNNQTLDDIIKRYELAEKQKKDELFNERCMNFKRYMTYRRIQNQKRKESGCGIWMDCKESPFDFHNKNTKD